MTDELLVENQGISRSLVQTRNAGHVVYLFGLAKVAAR